MATVALLVSVLSFCHSLSLGSPQLVDIVGYPGERMFYKCTPTSVYFVWRIRTTYGTILIPFANTSNGTSKSSQFSSVILTASVTYNNGSFIESTLTFIAHSSMNGASIQCDQYSTNFYVLTLIDLILIITYNASNFAYAISVLPAGRNISISVTSHHTPNTLYLISGNPGILHSLRTNILYNFTIFYQPSASFFYSMKCPFLVTTTDTVSVQYNITSEEVMTAHILHSDDKYLFLECGMEGWSYNVCSYDNTYHFEAMTTMEITSEDKIELSNKGCWCDVISVQLFVVLFVGFCILILIFGILVGILVGIRFMKLSVKRQKEFSSPISEHHNPANEIPNDPVYDNIAVEDNVKISRNMAYEMVKKM